MIVDQVLFHPKHKKLTIVSTGLLLIQVKSETQDEPFWMRREELEKYNKPVTPEDFHPRGLPEESDQPWQAFLREHSYINVHVHSDHVYKALDMVQMASGIRYSPKHSGITLVSYKWAPGFYIRWDTKGLPDGIPIKPRMVKYKSQEQFVISNNAFVLNLLGLGLVFGARLSNNRRS